jgi:hypothetical protein
MWFMNDDVWEVKYEVENGNGNEIAMVSEKPRKRMKGKGVDRGPPVLVGVFLRIEEKPKPIYRGGTLPT